MILLAVHAALLAWGAYRHSPTIDEVGHLPAGISHWQLGRFDLYRVNPPLIRMLAALPVVAAQPTTDWTRYSEAPGARPQFYVGRDFVAANGYRSFWLFTLARWACIPLSILGGYICFRWANELYGTPAGLLAVTLWCFCPNIVGHGQLITPDVGATALGVTACYAFWKWLKELSWSQASVVGVILGLAELAKTTLLAFFALWPLLWVICKAWGRRNRPYAAGPVPDRRSEAVARVSADTPAGGGLDRRGLREAGQLTLTLVLAVYVLNVGYGFEGSFQQLGEYQFVSDALTGANDPGRLVVQGQNRFADSWIGAIPVPLPKNYVLGIDQQKRDFERGFRSYLRGDWRHRGWWYYYLYGLAIKVPLGTWLLILLAFFNKLGWLVRLLGTTAKDTSPNSELSIVSRPVTWRDELLLLAPLVVILTLVSSQTGFSHHLRYVLPIFPFAFIWASQLAPAALSGGWLGRFVIGGAVLWSVGSSLWIYPHSLSYFNELVGGPTGGHAHLVDSNIDWGQDLLYLKRWLDKHPEARPLRLAYFGHIDPRNVGISFTLPPRPLPQDSDESGLATKTLAPEPGWFAVSVSILRGLQYPMPDGRGGFEWLDKPSFTYFQGFRPTAMAGYSIYIYRISEADAALVRSKLERGK
jgi:hypothetical protein